MYNIMGPFAPLLLPFGVSFQFCENKGLVGFTYPKKGLVGF